MGQRDAQKARKARLTLGFFRLISPDARPSTFHLQDHRPRVFRRRHGVRESSILSARLGGRYAGLIDLIRAGAPSKRRAKPRAASPISSFRMWNSFRRSRSRKRSSASGSTIPSAPPNTKTNASSRNTRTCSSAFPDSLVGHERPIVRPKVSEKFDYEGEIVLVIGREGRNVPRDQALSMVFGLTLGNEGSVRDWLRHGTLNVTQGKNFDQSGSLGPVDRAGRRCRSRQAAAPDDAHQRRAAPGRQHRAPDLGFLLADRIHHQVRDAETRRSRSSPARRSARAVIRRRRNGSCPATWSKSKFPRSASFAILSSTNNKTRVEPHARLQVGVTINGEIALEFCLRAL